MHIAIPLPSAVHDQIDLICCGLKHADWINREERRFNLMGLKQEDIQAARYDLRDFSYLPFTITLAGAEIHHQKKGRGKIWLNVQGNDALTDFQSKLRQLIPAEGSSNGHHVLIGHYSGEGVERLASYQRDFGIFFTPPFSVEEFSLYEEGHLVETFPLEEKKMSPELMKKLGLSSQE